jgi:hypothetical protein
MLGFLPKKKAGSGSAAESGVMNFVDALIGMVSILYQSVVIHRFVFSIHQRRVEEAQRASWGFRHPVRRGLPALC